jgi:hypothetical protein
MRFKRDAQGAISAPVHRWLWWMALLVFGRKKLLALAEQDDKELCRRELAGAALRDAIDREDRLQRDDLRGRDASDLQREASEKRGRAVQLLGEIAAAELEPQMKTTNAARRVGTIHAFIWWALVVTAATAAAAYLLAVPMGSCLSPAALGAIALYTRGLSAAFILCAVLSRPGWAIQSIDGNTLPEVLERKFFRNLYSLGMWLLWLSMFLRPR